MITEAKLKSNLENNVINLRYHARGGQGGVTASNLCVDAFYGDGDCNRKFVAAHMGSPTESYVRLSLNDDLVRNNEQVYAPHAVAVLDPSLLGEIDVTAGMAPGGWLIVNSTLDQVSLQTTVGRKDINIVTIDALNIAMEVLGKNITNTIILGALLRVVPIFTLDALADAIMKRFKGEIAGKNVAAIKRAYEESCIYESSEAPVIDFNADSKVPWQQVALGLPGYKELDKAGVWYRDEDVIKIGSGQVNTGSWGEWDIVWSGQKADGGLCTDCAQCWHICPDFAIIREKGDDGLWHMTGIDNFHCKACQNCIDVCPVNAISKKLKQGPAACAAPE